MKNNYKLNKEFTIKDKLRILKRGLKPNTTVKAICEEEGISPELYYEWYNKFINTGKEALIYDYEYNEINELLKKLIYELQLLNHYLEGKKK